MNKYGSGIVNHRLKGLVIAGNVYSVDSIDLTMSPCTEDPFCAQASDAWKHIRLAPNFAHAPGMKWSDDSGEYWYELASIPRNTVSNWWNSNNLQEHIDHVFEMRLETKNGWETYDAIFTGVGGPNFVNPIQMLTPENQRRGKAEGLVLGEMQERFEKRVTLHEFGHTLGMWMRRDGPPHPLPEEYVSVMSAGQGFLPESFDARDIIGIDLRRRENTNANGQ